MFARLHDALSGSKKKRTLSLTQLKSLNTVMTQNLVVNHENKKLVVESLRAIAEIVIWGDQNDPKVFEYFLENNMISYFDRILFQDPDIFIITQLLQTLNILLDNISAQTSIWFILSNNQMNSIITHRFDFANEEVLAYYISFLKSLAMKLNSDTLMFFHNEHLPNFPLYTEGIKFFNSKESMVRVAVRTLTLRVFTAAMHNDYTAEFLVKAAVPPYFSNLVWILGNLSISMDNCLRFDAGFENKGQLEYFVSEHLDLFCYMNDIIMLNFKKLTEHLSMELVDSLFIPLYVYCVSYEIPALENERQSIGMVVALYQLAQMFLIFDYPPMINTVAAALLLGKPDLGETRTGDVESLPMGMQQVLVQEDEMDKERAEGREERAAAIERRHRRLLEDRTYHQSADTTAVVAAGNTIDDDVQPAEEGNTPDASATSAAVSIDAGADVAATQVANDVVDVDAAMVTVVDGGEDTLPGGDSEDEHQQHSTQDISSVVQPHNTEKDDRGCGKSTQRGDSNDTDGGDILAQDSSNSNSSSTDSSSSSDVVEFEDPPSQEDEVENGDSNVNGIATTESGPVSPRPNHDHRSVIEGGGVTADMDEVEAKAAALGRLFALIDCSTDDVVALQVMVLLHAILMNQGMYKRILEAVSLHRPPAGAKIGQYNNALVSRLLGVISEGMKYDHSIRIVTVNLACQLLQTLTMCPPEETDDDPGALYKELHDMSVAQLAQVYEKPYRDGVDAQQKFLELFEIELKIMKPVKVPLLMSQATVLLMPPHTHIHGMDFEWRLPGTEDENTRKSLQLFFIVRKLWLTFHRERETVLPLRQPSKSIAVRDLIDMTEGDLIACTVISRGKNRQLVQVRRYMLVDAYRLVLVEPTTSKPGMGAVRFIADLNFVLACPETHSMRALQLVIRQPKVHNAYTRGPDDTSTAHDIIFSGRLVFDNHIRCVAAQQYLERGRVTLRTEKLQLVEGLMGMAKAPELRSSSAGSITPPDEGTAVTPGSPDYVAGHVQNL